MKGRCRPRPGVIIAVIGRFPWKTALALLAGGVAVEAFTGALFAPPVRVVLSTVLLVLAALLRVRLRELLVARLARLRGPVRTR